MGTLPHVCSAIETLRKRQNLGLYTEVIYFDLKSAFDTVDHAILREKLVSDVRLPSWFKSFIFKVYGNTYITPTLSSIRIAKYESVKVNRGVV
jgi:hypothetical protein